MHIKSFLIEKGAKDSALAQRILTKYPDTPHEFIDDYRQVFGKVRKPYLAKRDGHVFFIASPKERLLKEAPDAYGAARGTHYYFTHGYNCIYECEYCYLQASLPSPDIVLFAYPERICDQIAASIDKHPVDEELWFHAGEFSDSLALSALTKEWPVYFDFFRKQTRAFLELRTKSCNIRSILAVEPTPQVVISFSLSSSSQINKFDHQTPPLASRLKAISSLVARGFSVGVHFDPLIYQPDYLIEFESLVEKLWNVTGGEVAYISIGVVRFPKHLWNALEKHYPGSDIFSQPMIKAKDGQVKYPLVLRNTMLGHLESLLVTRGFAKKLIYRCMEEIETSIKLS